MSRPKAPPRVKLYEEKQVDGRTRYRVRVIEDGRGQNTIFWSEAAAQQFQAAALRELRSRSASTVVALVDEYLDEKRRLGKVSPKTCAEQKPRLLQLLSTHAHSRIADITPRIAQTIYDELLRAPSRKTGRPLQTASHRFYLELLRSFFAWAVRKSHLTKSPFAEVRPVGRPHTGKRQLRAAEAERFLQTALRLYDDSNDVMALAAALLLLFGLRASEALSRRVRDVDRIKDRWLLWIDEGHGDVSLKTRNARRHHEVPSILSNRLSRLISDRAPDEWLFGASPSGGPRCRQQLWSTVRRICAAAEVPAVCPHSLRGLHATLGIEAGLTPHAVAAALGHGSFAITAKHYAQPESLSFAKTARVIDVLDLQNAPPRHTPREQALTLLQTLDTETLTQMLSLVAVRKAPAS